jgi:hypothetical protein
MVGISEGQENKSWLDFADVLAPQPPLLHVMHVACCMCTAHVHVSAGGMCLK